MFDDRCVDVEVQATQKSTGQCAWFAGEECSWGKDSLLWRRMEFHLPAVTGRSVRDEKRRGVRVGSEKEFVFPFCPPSLF